MFFGLLGVRPVTSRGSETHISLLVARQERIFLASSADVPTTSLPAPDNRTDFGWFKCLESSDDTPNIQSVPEGQGASPGSTTCWRARFRGHSTCVSPQLFIHPNVANQGQSTTKFHSFGLCAPAWEMTSYMAHMACLHRDFCCPNAQTFDPVRACVRVWSVLSVSSATSRLLVQPGAHGMSP